jgi:hypothetical protein
MYNCSFNTAFLLNKGSINYIASKILTQVAGYKSLDAS